MEQFPVTHAKPLRLFPNLKELPQPPCQLFVRGIVRTNGKKLLAVVGSRACTAYGKTVCRDLINGLRGQPIVIVSGLALGIDAAAHRAALAAGLTTIAFPGSSLEWSELYPPSNNSLAKDILTAGGALVAEHRTAPRGAYWLFPERNRLIAGVCDMVLVIEAERKSGTLITARLGTEYNKIVAAVPGPITAPMSAGANWLLQQGAVPVVTSADIVRELGLPQQVSAEDIVLTPEESRVLSALHEPKTRDMLIQELSLSSAACAIIISSLEIKGLIHETLGCIERSVPHYI